MSKMTLKSSFRSIEGRRAISVGICKVCSEERREMAEGKEGGKYEKKRGKEREREEGKEED